MVNEAKQPRTACYSYVWRAGPRGTARVFPRFGYDGDGDVCGTARDSMVEIKSNAEGPERIILCLTWKDRKKAKWILHEIKVRDSLES